MYIVCTMYVYVHTAHTLFRLGQQHSVFDLTEMATARAEQTFGRPFRLVSPTKFLTLRAFSNLICSCALILLRTIYKTNTFWRPLAIILSTTLPVKTPHNTTLHLTYSAACPSPPSPP